MCLDVKDHGDFDGSVLQLWECLDDDTDQNFLTPSEYAYAPIKWANHVEKCVDVKDQLSDNGNVIQIWDCGAEDTFHDFDASQSSTKPEGPFDLIIVGAGLAGSVVAGILSRDFPGHRILLLEAGHASQKELGGTDPPASWDHNAGEFRDWPGNYDGLTRYDIPSNYETLNSFDTRTSAGWKGYPDDVYQCKILGGCDVLNGALRQIPPKSMFDTWPDGWKWSDMEKYYDDAENIFSLSETPSTDGKHYLAESGADATKQALGSAGFESGDAFAPKPNQMGIPVVSTLNGVRQSTASIYLPDAMKRPNFKLHLASEVSMINMKRGSTATGVAYTKDNVKHQASLSENGIVVLAAGVFGTVKLLLESGIQNGEVGKGISDHGYRHLGFDGVSGVEGFSSSVPDQSSLDDYIHKKIGPVTQFGPTFLAYFKAPHTSGPPEAFDVEAFVWPSSSTDSVSVGMAMLRPSCSHADLVLEGGSLRFSNDDLYNCESDNKAMDDAALKIGEAFKKSFNARANTAPTGQASGGSKMERGNHWAGGCSLERCLDPKTMLVLGTSNVAVVDSSLFPSTIWSHPSFTCAVTAAKAADILAEMLRKP